ncbi:hypothetical protein TNCV_664401 [Trichonephila clavipes]|nr:hypothetical protein TNCV_664401 [Trichonephila clavipes]
MIISDEIHHGPSWPSGLGRELVAYSVELWVRVLVQLKTHLLQRRIKSVEAQSSPIPPEPRSVAVEREKKDRMGNIQLLKLTATRNYPADSPAVVQVSNYRRVFGDGSRNFESRSSDKDDACAGASCPNFHTPPTGGCLSFDRFNGHHSPTLHVFSDTRLELRTRRPRFRYLDH